MMERSSTKLACAGLTATGFFWALNTVIGRGTVGEIPPVALAFWRWTLAFLTLQIGLGIPVIAPFFLAESALGGLHLPRFENLWIYLIIAIGPSLLAYQFWNNGVRRIGASRAALFLYLIPVFAAALGYFILDERLAVFHAAGGSLIFAGLLLATRTKSLRTSARSRCQIIQTRPISESISCIDQPA